MFRRFSDRAGRTRHTTAVLKERRRSTALNIVCQVLVAAIVAPLPAMARDVPLPFTLTANDPCADQCKAGPFALKDGCVSAWAKESLASCYWRNGNATRAVDITKMAIEQYVAYGLDPEQVLHFRQFPDTREELARMGARDTLDGQLIHQRNVLALYSNPAAQHANRLSIERDAANARATQAASAATSITVPTSLAANDRTDVESAFEYLSVKGIVDEKAKLLADPGALRANTSFVIGNTFHYRTDMDPKLRAEKAVKWYRKGLAALRAEIAVVESRHDQSTQVLHANMKPVNDTITHYSKLIEDDQDTIQLANKSEAERKAAQQPPAAPETQASRCAARCATVESSCHDANRRRGVFIAGVTGSLFDGMTGGMALADDCGAQRDSCLAGCR